LAIFISFSVRPSTPTQKKSYYCIPIPGDFGFGSIFIFSGYFIRARERCSEPPVISSSLPPFSILNYIRSPDEMALYFIAIFFQNFHFFFYKSRRIEERDNMNVMASFLPCLHGDTALAWGSTEKASTKSNPSFNLIPAPYLFFCHPSPRLQNPGFLQ